MTAFFFYCGTCTLLLLAALCFGYSTWLGMAVATLATIVILVRNTKVRKWEK